MSDFNSSLPVRTENAGDVIVRVADATVTAQQLAVNADGSVNITDNGGSITVDGAVTVSATDLDIRDLAFATDKVDVTGSEVSLDATTLAALESVTIQNGSGASAVNIQDGGNSITVDGSVTVSATDLDIRDLSFATDKVDVSGSTVNAVITDSGTQVTSYNVEESLAKDAPDNHDLTSTGNTSKLYQVFAAASGKLKIKVQIETAAASGIFNTVAVGYNSTANPNIDISFSKPLNVPNGAIVRVIRTNLDSPQDVHSTIITILG